MCTILLCGVSSQVEQPAVGFMVGSRCVMAAEVGKVLASDTTDKSIKLNSWISYVHPTYGERQALPADARRQNIARGGERFGNGRFLAGSSWAGSSDRLLKQHKQYV